MILKWFIIHKMSIHPSMKIHPHQNFIQLNLSSSMNSIVDPMQSIHLIVVTQWSSEFLTKCVERRRWVDNNSRFTASQPTRNKVMESDVHSLPIDLHSRSLLKISARWCSSSKPSSLKSYLLKHWGRQRWVATGRIPLCLHAALPSPMFTSIGIPSCW